MGGTRLLLLLALGICQAERRPLPAQAARLQQWAHELELLHQSVRLEETEGRGIGVFTTQPIGAGSILIRTPASMCVTEARAKSEEGGVTVLLERVNPPVEAHVAMAVWLMRARDRPPPQLAPWLAALPQAFDCTLEWSEAELQHLHASPARERAEVLRQWSRAEYARIFSTFGPPLDFDASYSRFVWALSAVWSRSFQLESKAGGTWRVLVPVADMLNHVEPVGINQAEPEAVFRVVADEGKPELWHTTAAREEENKGRRARHINEEEAFALVAARDIPAGNEVHLDYGPRSNAELLTTHGFALLTSAYEEVKLNLGPSPDDELAELKRRILTAGNLSAPYALKGDSLTSDSDIVCALRVLVATAAELAGSEKTGDKGRGYARAFEGLPISPANERRWHDVLARQLRLLLKQRESFGTAMDDANVLESEDASALGVLAEAKSSERGQVSEYQVVRGSRQWMAVVTRCSEKVMLRRVLEQLDARRRTEERAFAAAFQAVKDEV